MGGDECLSDLPSWPPRSRLSLSAAVHAPTIRAMRQRRPRARASTASPEALSARPSSQLDTRWFAGTACVAVALTFFAIFRVDLAGSHLVSFRYHESWRRHETLRVVAPLAPSSASPFALSALSDLYAHYALSPKCASLLYATVICTAPTARSSASQALRSPLVRCPAGTRSRLSLQQPRPEALLEIEATGGSEADATQTAARISNAVTAFLVQKQNEAAIPLSQRVRFEAAGSPARNVERFQGRRLIGPLIALTIVLALLALAVVSRRSEHRQ